jgi:hypothetical protein
VKTDYSIKGTFDKPSGKSMITFCFTVNFGNGQSLELVSTSPFSTSKGLSGRIVYRFDFPNNTKAFVFDFKTNNFMKVEFVTGLATSLVGICRYPLWHRHLLHSYPQNEFVEIVFV